MRCPECKAVIGIQLTHYPHFHCPFCDCDLCVPTSFRLKALIVGAAIAIVVCYLLGLRGMFLLLCAIPASLTLGGVATFVGMTLMPPVLEKYWAPGNLGLKG